MTLYLMNSLLFIAYIHTHIYTRMYMVRPALLICTMNFHLVVCFFLQFVFSFFLPARACGVPASFPDAQMMSTCTLLSAPSYTCTTYFPFVLPLPPVYSLLPATAYGVSPHLLRELVVVWVPLSFILLAPPTFSSPFVFYSSLPPFCETSGTRRVSVLASPLQESIRLTFEKAWWLCHTSKYNRVIWTQRFLEQGMCMSWQPQGELDLLII